MPSSEKIAVTILDLYKREKTLSTRSDDAQKHIELADEKKEELSYQQYVISTASNKIGIIQRAIIRAYKAMQNQHPDSEWIIIVWREYGIFDLSFLTHEDQKKLKSVLTELINNSPKLIIVAGAILYKKTTTSDKLDKVLQAYLPHKDILKAESKILNCSHPFNQAYQQIKNSQKCLPDNTVFFKLKNVSYVAAHQNPIAQHGKITPYNEYHGGNTFFQPPNSKGISPIISIVNKENQQIKLGIEICREHYFSLLKQYATKSATSIDLQFLMSSSIRFYLEKYCASLAAFHADSLDVPRMLVAKQGLKNNIAVYAYNIFENNSQLTALEPTYPIQFQILDKIDECLSLYQFTPEVTLQLNDFKKAILKVAPAIPISLNEYKKLLKEIEIMQSNIQKIIAKPHFKENLVGILALQQILPDLVIEMSQNPNNKKQYDFPFSEIQENKSNCTLM